MTLNDALNESRFGDLLNKKSKTCCVSSFLIRIKFHIVMKRTSLLQTRYLFWISKFYFMLPCALRRHCHWVKKVSTSSLGERLLEKHHALNRTDQWLATLSQRYLCFKDGWTSWLVNRAFIILFSFKPPRIIAFTQNKLYNC